MKVIITFTFCCDDLWNSKFVALEKAWKSLGILFLLLCGHPVRYENVNVRILRFSSDDVNLKPSLLHGAKCYKPLNLEKN